MGEMSTVCVERYHLYFGVLVLGKDGSDIFYRLFFNMLGIFTHVNSLNPFKIMRVRYCLVFMIPVLHEKTLWLKEIKYLLSSHSWEAIKLIIWRQRDDP